MNYSRGDVVLVRFPNSDLTTYKKRPALIVQDTGVISDFGQAIAAAITTSQAVEEGPTRIMNCVECQTGKPPEKQLDMSIEEIEDDMNQLMSSECMEQLAIWLESRPLAVKQVAQEFAPHQLYVVKEGAPYKYTVEGSVVAPFSFKQNKRLNTVETTFKVLRSPIGHAGVVAVIDPAYVRPISLADLKEMVKGES